MWNNNIIFHKKTEQTQTIQATYFNIALPLPPSWIQRTAWYPKQHNNCWTHHGDSTKEKWTMLHNSLEWYQSTILAITNPFETESKKTDETYGLISEERQGYQDQSRTTKLLVNLRLKDPLKVKSTSPCFAKNNNIPKTFIWGRRYRYGPCCIIGLFTKNSTKTKWQRQKINQLKEKETNKPNIHSPTDIPTQETRAHTAFHTTSSARNLTFTDEEFTPIMHEDSYNNDRNDSADLNLISF